MIDRKVIKAQLILTYKPKDVSDTPCALCQCTGGMMSLHLLEVSIPETSPLPPYFVPTARSRGRIKGCFPICTTCAPICSKCGIAMQSKRFQDGLVTIIASAPQGASVYAGNGYCRHLNIFKKIRQKGLPAGFRSPFERIGSTENLLREETEADGYRAEAHRRGRVRHAAGQAQKKRNPSDEQHNFANYRIGSLISGKFRIKRIIDGGLGRIFVVKDEDGFQLALKSVQPGKIDEETFANEARTWVSLGYHMNIVTAFWIERIAGMLCVAAQFIPPDENGLTTLRDVIKHGKPSLRQVLSLSTDFCYGMEHAINKGIIAHRDIKPENLLLGRNGFLKIIDFGISSSKPLEWVNSEPSNQIALQGVSGTPAYMAPEQWLAKQQDFRTDVYAFGLILHELSFGRLPWGMTKIMNLRNSHLSLEPKVPDHPLSKIILRAISKAPEERFHSPNDLLRALAKVARDAGFSLPPKPMATDAEVEELFAKSFLAASGNFDQALAAASLLTEKWPHFSPGWTQLGRLWLEFGDLDKAQISSKRAVEIDDSRSAPWNNLGMVEQRRKDDQAAINFFLTALDCDNKNTGAMSNLANSLRFLGKLDEAIRWLKKAGGIAPDKGNIWINLGSTHRQLGDEAEAKKCFKKALRCFPPSQREALARQFDENSLENTSDEQVVDIAKYVKEGRFDIAMPALLKASAKQPTNSNVWYNLAIACREQGMVSEARSAFAQLSTLEPQNGFAIRSQIELAREVNDWKEAERLCDKLASIPNERLNSIVERSRTLAESGQMDQARKVIEGGLKEHPKHIGILVTFGDLAFAAGAPLAGANRGYGPALKLISKNNHPTLYKRTESKFSKAIEAALKDGSLIRKR